MEFGKDEVFSIISGLLGDQKIDITDETVLIGGKGLFDSMKLLELCFELEDKALDLGFEFDWTSDAAMSKSRSLFKTAGSLTDEFLRQQKEQSQ